MTTPALPLALTLLAALLGLPACSVEPRPAPSGGTAADQEAPANPGPRTPSPSPSPPSTGDPAVSATDPPAASLAVATLGAGCFWCVEAVLEQVDGVHDVVSGYMGGTVSKPTYSQVCSGTTGHAEVVQVRFEPAVLSYEDLLDWFWRLHDPTTLNRQGADVGTQYRSAIFVHDAEQRRVAEASKAAADASGRFGRPIVTEITDAGPFWPAEDDHQDYYRQNKAQGYCRMVIAPKLDKLGLDP